MPFDVLRDGLCGQCAVPLQNTAEGRKMRAESQLAEAKSSASSMFESIQLQPGSGIPMLWWVDSSRCQKHAGCFGMPGGDILSTWHCLSKSPRKLTETLASHSHVMKEYETYETVGGLKVVVEAGARGRGPHFEPPAFAHACAPGVFRTGSQN